VLANRIGGLSGIGIHPVAVYAVYKCYTACCRKNNIDIIGLGGVTNAEEALELILAGAACVGVGTAMFREPNVFEDVAKGILAYMKRKGVGAISELIGKAVG
jgi:dihydroorotate dehydrogenase (NAD+) catalytic subunit